MPKTEFVNAVTVVSADWLNSVYVTDGGHTHDGADADGSVAKVHPIDHVDWAAEGLAPEVSDVVESGIVKKVLTLLPSNEAHGVQLVVGEPTSPVAQVTTRVGSFTTAVETPEIRGDISTGVTIRNSADSANGSLTAAVITGTTGNFSTGVTSPLGIFENAVSVPAVFAVDVTATGVVTAGSGTSATDGFVARNVPKYVGHVDASADTYTAHFGPAITVSNVLSIMTLTLPVAVSGTPPVFIQVGESLTPYVSSVTWASTTELTVAVWDMGTSAATLQDFWISIYA